MLRHGGSLDLHREVSVFIYARQWQDTFPATIFLFESMPKKEYCFAMPSRSAELE